MLQGLAVAWLLGPWSSVSLAGQSFSSRFHPSRVQASFCRCLPLSSWKPFAQAIPFEALSLRGKNMFCFPPNPPIRAPRFLSAKSWQRPKGLLDLKTSCLFSPTSCTCNGISRKMGAHFYQGYWATASRQLA